MIRTRMSMMGLLSVSLLAFFGAFRSLAKVMMGVLARRFRLPRMQEQRSYSYENSTVSSA